jgi:hypothetical protein
MVRRLPRGLRVATETIMRFALSVLLVGSLTAAPALAKHPHEGKSGNKHWKAHHWDDDDDQGDHHAGACYFRRQDIRIMREYYAPRYRSLPPGLTKKFYRTGHLPPGWEKKIEPLPIAVERELVVLPSGYRRGYMDGAVVVYSPRTRVMIDVVAVFGG